MSPRTSRFRSVVLRALLISGLLAVGIGCGLFDPDTDDRDPPDDFQYPALDSPQHTLSNLKLAWDRRDSTRAKQIYATDYRGTAITPESTVFFSKDQEVELLWQLGKDPEVTWTEMVLNPESTWVVEQFPSDPADWRTIRLLKGVKLEVTKGLTTYRAQNSDIEYKFKPDTIGTTISWRIVRWQENYTP